jgi:hypothetical protein
VTKSASRSGIVVEADSTASEGAPLMVEGSGSGKEPSASNRSPPQQESQIETALPPSSASGLISPNSMSPDSEEQRPSTAVDASLPSTDRPMSPADITPVQPFSSPSQCLVDSSMVGDTPGASLAEIVQISNNVSATPNPNFMLDWNQLQMPSSYNELMQPPMLLNQDMNFIPDTLTLPQHHESLMAMMPNLHNGMQPLQLNTPIETPRLQPLMTGSAMSTPFFQNHPISSMQPFNSLPAPVNDISTDISAQDAWPAFRCMPVVPSTACPRTARRNLELLERTLRNHEGWVRWSPQWDEADVASSNQLTVMQLHESSRDKLLAITQTFLHKALDIHRGDPGGNHHAPQNGAISNFVLLPPARVLEYFLQSYANSFEQFYPLTSRGTLDANELLHCYNDRVASLLVLMMIAQGASNVPSTDARILATGLTESSRLSLFDLIEKNYIMSGNPLVLHAALLFTVQAAWSGDKWQMDISMGQRGMYLAMLRHSGLLELHHRMSAPTTNQAPNTDLLWSEWIQAESRSRLVYSWLMVDQDIALLHDCAPLFSVTEFKVPMPDADRLWRSRSAAEWSANFEQVHEFAGGFSSVGSDARPMSLLELYGHFLDNELIALGIEMTPLQLRLLLHPLQSLVWQSGQLLRCFNDPFAIQHQDMPRTVSASSTKGRLEEAQNLLQRWYDLAERYLNVNAMCPMMQTNLVIFHLISLNAATNFTDIERVARRELVGTTYQEVSWLHKRCIADIEEAVYHCGQILRLIRSMPRSVRPPWWAGAMYRVALVLWANCLITGEFGSSPIGSTMFPRLGSVFAIDSLSAEHPLIVRYLTKRDGIPCMTKRDGSQVVIDRPLVVLQHCVEVIDEGVTTRFSEGVRSKLQRLASAHMR